MTIAGAVHAATVVPGGGAPTARDGAVAWDADGLVTYAGPRTGWDGEPDGRFPGGTVVPGFVDCHTHLPFAGWRDDEFEARLAGATYRDQHGRGGGIARSARMLAEATDQRVLELCRPLLAEMLRLGTTTVEMKTGYGLSVEGELRQARLARALAEEAPQTIVVTLLAAHAVPEGHTRREWVDLACRELIPRAAAEGLVDAVDIYVEDIAFTVEDLHEVAAAAAQAGLPLRCHAEQLGATGAAAAAAGLGARSADHLNHLDEDGVRALAGSGTTAVLLPASTLLLRAKPPPVDALRAAGVPVALGSDFNPGTSPVLSMPEVVALGCSLYGMAPGEALAAITEVPSRVVGLEGTVGTLKPGARADLVVVEGEDFRMVPYRPGHDPVMAVYAGGQLVYRRG
jgi:imidazolonepropionase